MAVTIQTGDSATNKITIDLRVVTVVLLLAIVGMLLAWKPWETPAQSEQRTVTVTGEAQLSDRPDEFVFYPSYQFKNEDKAAALAELTKKSDEVVAKLKSLGVADKNIKTNAGGYDAPVFYDVDSRDTTYTLQLTVTVGTAKLAQSVQDYLVSTSPTGSVSPQANFSTAKRKQLEDKARDEASKDARAKADQMAHNLGFKIGRVKSVSDVSGFGITPILMESAAPAADSRAKADMGLGIQPGENDLNYSVTVVYFVR